MNVNIEVFETISVDFAEMNFILFWTFNTRMR